MTDYSWLEPIERRTREVKAETQRIREETQRIREETQTWKALLKKRPPWEDPDKK